MTTKIKPAEKLTITLVQTDIVWENPNQNRENYEQILEGISESDVLIFPEMFTTGFSMQPEHLKEKMNGETVVWMQKIAKQKNAAIVASVIIQESKHTFNRAIWAFPDGKIETYDKRHLYTMGQEHEFYTPGKNKTIIELKGWKFCPQICYDLRFPVFARNMENYDVLFYMANWPAPRHHVWKNLLIARAIENQSYCFGVNRTGSDGMGLDYLGDSGYISPKGISHFLGSKPLIKSFSISYSDLHTFRKKFPLLNDKDTFQIL